MADRHLGLPVVLGVRARIVRTASTGHGRVRGDDCACNYARDGGPLGASGQSFAHGGPFDGEHFARLGRVVAQPRQPARRPDPYNALTRAWSGPSPSRKLSADLRPVLAEGV